VVDDNSPDGTLEVAQQLQRMKWEAGSIVIHSRPGKLGLGTAYMDGLKRCSGEFVFLMDADMSHHPRYMADFIRKQREGKYDIVTGTRNLGSGGTAGWDFQRVLTSRGANLMANMLLWPGVTDLTGSFRLYKRNVIEDLIKSVKGKTYVFQMEVISEYIRRLLRLH
jgi:dolichol-phosphate mannosyltransferase